MGGGEGVGGACGGGSDAPKCRRCSGDRDALTVTIIWRRSEMTSGENNRPNNQIKLAKKTPRCPNRTRVSLAGAAERGAGAQQVGKGGDLWPAT